MAKIPFKEIIYSGTLGSEAQLEVCCLEGMELNYQDFYSVFCADFQNAFL